MTEQEIARLGREALEQSVEHLDAHTLSRLNQARQQALADAQRPPFWRSGWLPLTAAGCTALALAIALPMTTPVEQPVDSLALPMLADEANMAALEDAELLEDLDMMLWLVDVENHAS